MIDRTVVSALKNRWLVLSSAALCAGLGIWSYTRLFIDAYPDISGTMVQIITAYPGRAAEEVEQEVTIPIERTLAGVPKVDIIRSRTIFGLSLVQLNFESGADDYWAREVVFQKLSEVALPEEAQPSMGSLSTAYGEIYAYYLTGDAKHGPMELRTLNDWVIIPRLLRAKGVIEIANLGGLAKQYTIRLDKNKLLRYGIKLQEVISAVRDNNISGGGSVLQRGSSALSVRGIGRFKDPAEMERVFIKNANGTPVFVRDIGTVVTDHHPQTGIFSRNDMENGVAGVVRMRRGENPSVVLANIKEAVRELNESGLPEGVKIQPYYDRTELIRETLSTVLHNTFLGIGLVILTILLFLNSPKIAFIVALTIPGSLLFALCLMKLTGIPISLLSIGSIDFGIIVDGAIIMAENIMRRLAARTAEEKKAGHTAVILDASRQVQSPVLFSMLIVIIAYLPLLMLKNIEGLLFRPMAITLCYTLVGALLIALYLVPVLATFLFRDGAEAKEPVLFEKLRLLYENGLRKAVCARWKVAAAALALLAATVFVVLPRLGTEFLPYIDEGGFWIRANFPAGISLRENAYYTARMRKIAREFEEISFATSLVGRNDSGYDPFPGNRVEIMLGLKPMSKWKNHKTKLGLEAALRERFKAEFPTTRFNFTQLIIDSVTEDTNGTSANLAVEILGQDLAVLRALAEKTDELIKTVPGNVDANIEQEEAQPQLQIRVGRTRLSRYQLSADSVMTVVNTAIGGEPVSQMYEGDRRFDIVVKYSPEFIGTPEKIGRLPVFNEMGEPVPLAQVSNIWELDGQTIIARAGGKRRVTVRCDIRGRAQGDFVAEAQELFARNIKLPPGYTVAWMGMFENLDRARKHFSILIPMTVGIIFAILFLAFRSAAMAGLVLLTVPFAMIGSSLALFIRGMHFNVSVGVGLTSLFGVATMLGVVMVSNINDLRTQRGMDIDSAILHGGAILFRPVIMTAVVAILGLLPASLASGIGSDVQRPIATVVVWGLFSAIFLTLFVLPALYRIVEPEIRRPGGAPKPEPQRNPVQ